MTYYNLFCFAKLYAVVTGLDKQSLLTKAEIDAACEALKSMADSSNNLTQEQKEWYKLIVDFCKEQTEKYNNGRLENL